MSEMTASKKITLREKREIIRQADYAHELHTKTIHEMRELAEWRTTHTAPDGKRSKRPNGWMISEGALIAKEFGRSVKGMDDVGLLRVCAARQEATRACRAIYDAGGSRADTKAARKRIYQRCGREYKRSLAEIGESDE